MLKLVGTISELDKNSIQLSEDQKTATTVIEVLKVGVWKHPEYGKVVITPERLMRFKENFDNKVRSACGVDRDHAPENGMVGWFKSLTLSDDKKTLLGTVEFNKDGIDDIETKRRPFFSADFRDRYESKTEDKVFKDVLIGGALTARPYIEELSEVILSEKNLLEGGENNNMTKEEMKKKMKEGWKCSETDDEDTKKMFAELEKEEADEKKAKELSEIKLGEGTFKKNADGNIVLSEADARALIEGNQKTLAEVKRMKTEKEVDSFIFSEKNTKGVFVSGARDEVVDFVVSLNESQKSQFTKIIESMKKLDPKMFSEVTSDTHTGEEPDDSKPVDRDEAQDALDKRAKKLLSEGKVKTYSEGAYEAEKQLLSEGVLVRGKNY